MNPIQMATTDELIDELRNRFAALLIVTERDAEGEKDCAENAVFFKGSLPHALGLADASRIYIGRMMDPSFVDGGDE